MGGEDAEDPGCDFSSLPPCLDPETFPRCHGCIEQGCCCRLFGRVGCERPCGVRRHRWMGCATFLGVVGLLLNIFACLGMSTTPAILKQAAWSVGKLDCDDLPEGLCDDKLRLYVGLSRPSASLF